MLVSVIMPTYNNEREIGLALVSLLLQDFEDFELVVVDDASTDNTYRILQRIGLMDERIVILRNEINLGRASSRNLALMNARGKYLAIMDADDISMPGRLSSQVDYLEKNADVGLLGSWAIRIDEKNTPIGRIEGPSGNSVIRKYFLQLSMPFIHSSIMFRRGPLFATELYDPRFVRSQDGHLCRRVLKHTNASVIPECLVLYRASGALSPQAARANYRWARSAGWDYLRHSPNFVGYLNLFRYILYSSLPDMFLQRFSGIYRKFPLPTETQKYEISKWVERLNSFVIQSSSPDMNLDVADMEKASGISLKR